MKYSILQALLIWLIILSYQAFGQDHTTASNLNAILNEPIQTQFGFLSRKEQLSLIKPKGVSLIIDLRADRGDDFTKIVKTELTEKPLFSILDHLLQGTELYYHLDGKMLVISSEFLWLTKEKTYPQNYDVTNLYNLKNDLKELIATQFQIFDIAKCKHEIKIPKATTVTIIANRFQHEYIQDFFNALKKPVHDFTLTSTQIAIPAQQYKNHNKILDIEPMELTAKEWLILLCRSLNEKYTLQNTITEDLLNQTKIKIESTPIHASNIIQRLSEITPNSFYYRNENGFFFTEQPRQKLSSIQNTSYRVYSVKQLTEKISGLYICQHIKDEIHPDIWIYPGNQILYFKHLNVVIISCPSYLFPKIDTLFLNLTEKYTEK